MLESCVVGFFAAGRRGNIVGGEVVSFDTVGVPPQDGSWVGFRFVGWFDIRNSIAGALEGERDDDAGALVLFTVVGPIVVGMGSSVILVVGRNVSPHVGISVILAVGLNVSPRVGILVGSVVK